jgi:ATP-binding cassette, subfamily B, bacterial PglK
VSYLRQIIFLVGKDIRRIPWLLLAFITSSLMDLIGLGLIFPYVSLIMNPESIQNNSFYQYLSSAWGNPAVNQLVLIVGFILGLVFLCKMACSLLVNWIILNFSYHKGANLRAQLMKNYQELPYSEYLQRNSSEYIHAIQLLAAQFSQTTLQTTLRFISEGLMVLAILFFLAWTNALALAILLGLVLGIVFLYDRVFRHRITNYGKLSNVYQTQMVQGIHEGVEGLKEIRILGAEDHFHQKVSKKAEKYADLFAKSQILGMAPRYILEFILIFFVVFVVFLTINSGQDLKSIVPALSVFGVASLRLIPAANVFSNGISQMRFGRNATQLIYNDLKKSRDVAKTIDAESIAAEELGGKVEFQGLELNEVNFSYEGTDPLVLRDISISIDAGESIGIIGSTGSGKTTLINVMLGLLVPTSGQICINGLSILDNVQLLRRNVAYLPQNVFLIDDTLRRNIALGIEDDDIDESKILSVLEQVRLAEFIRSLPEGLDSQVGEHGMRLSGGQRQRVALARALYHERSVLVLDESTSALDNETEREIIKEFKSLKRKKTMIVIAHRLTTIEHCDRIYQLGADGCIHQVSYEDITRIQVS